MSTKVPTATQRTECKKECKCPCKAKCAAFRAEVLKRTIQHYADLKAKQQEIIKTKKECKKNGDLYAAAEEKLILVIRISGVNHIPPKYRKILKLLRLRQINNAVFVRANASSLKMLRLVEPYITYGYPSLNTVKHLIYKRGALKINGQRIPITSNCMIKRALGKLDVICVEDIINQIYSVGKNFKEVNNKLCPFKLNSPHGGLSKYNKKVHFILGGAFGNREKLINKLSHSKPIKFILAYRHHKNISY